MTRTVYHRTKRLRQWKNQLGQRRTSHLAPTTAAALPCSAPHKAFLQ
jgi:hypothetical protein